MSKLIEINEGNYVLDYNDMATVDKTFKYFIRNATFDKHRDAIRFQLDSLFLKINKLNEMAKERKE